MVGICQRCGRLAEIEVATNGNLQLRYCVDCLRKVRKVVCMWDA